MSKTQEEVIDYWRAMAIERGQTIVKLAAENMTLCTKLNEHETTAPSRKEWWSYNNSYGQLFLFPERVTYGGLHNEACMIIKRPGEITLTREELKKAILVRTPIVYIARDEKNCGSVVKIDDVLNDLFGREK